MGLAALAAAPGPGVRTNKVAHAYTNMSPGEAEAFRLVIVDPLNYSSAGIARAMQEDGYDIAAAQIVHYRTLLREGKVSL